MAKQPSKKLATTELGCAGGNKFDGFNSDEFIPSLRGQKAIKKYREMKDNDAVIGASLSAMDMMIRAVEWRVEAVDETAQAEQAKEFVESLFDDMSHTFEDTISEILTFLPFGFSFFETVMKKRDGMNPKGDAAPSKYNDGLIGIRKIAPRAQWTIERFIIGDDGGVEGVVQRNSNNACTATIPIEKGLLFRTTTVNNEPTGRSVLRNAYIPYYRMTNIQEIEAIAIERELNGIPIGRIPSEYLASDASDDQKAFVAAFKKILRDVKLNEQGYILIPSDTYEDDEGKPSNIPLVQFDLVSSNGKRSIDTGKTITRYQQDMARSLLADFLMLGQSERGSFALSKSKTDLFLRSIESFLNSIASVLNRHLLTRVWDLNGFDYAIMPKLVPGPVAPVDLNELGSYIRNVSGAGAQFFPDIETENVLRDAAGLPESNIDNDLMGVGE